MPYLVFLTASLVIFWLLLSGFWDKPLLLGLGAASVALVAYMAWQIERRYPSKAVVSMLTRLPGYWLWLLREIIKANLDVLKRIWLPSRHPVSPALSILPMTQQTHIGRTIYANSITLTPGTVSIDVQGNSILVHAISAEGIADLEGGEMDCRVTALEGNNT